MLTVTADDKGCVVEALAFAAFFANGFPAGQRVPDLLGAGDHTALPAPALVVHHAGRLLAPEGGREYLEKTRARRR